MQSDEKFIDLTKRALKEGVFWDQSQNGNTALHWALLNNQFLKAVTLLNEEALYRQANPLCKNILMISNKGAPPITPIDIAHKKADELPAELAGLLSITVKPKMVRPQLSPAN